MTFIKGENIPKQVFLQDPVGVKHNFCNHYGRMQEYCLN